MGMALRIALAAGALMMADAAVAGQTLTAAESDPAKLGWMQGTPPPADRQVRAGNHLDFPRSRWAFSNWRRLFPTAPLLPVSPQALPAATQIAALDDVRFTPIGGTAEMRWKDSLGANYTDAIVVLHRGRPVYQWQGGVTTLRTPHMLWSVSKSFTGLLAEVLIAEGRLDAEARVDSIVPELAGSGFGSATVRQVMDMTTAIRFSEAYGDANSDISRYAISAGFYPRPAGFAAPEGIVAFLESVPADGAHGERFTYRTVNTDALSWIVARAGGAPLVDQFQQRYWGPVGMADGGDFHLDALGTPFAGGGLNASVLDLARFGEMVRLGGMAGGRRILPEAAFRSIRAGGDPAKFPAATYPTLPGWSYRSQWWIAPDGVLMARGVHGQAIWIDPGTETVIARVASHPSAANVPIDPATLPAFRAVADWLAANDR